MLLVPMEQDLHNLKDDMIAFIEGHGMKRFQGYVKDDLPSVPWSPEENHPDHDPPACPVALGQPLTQEGPEE